MRKQTNYYKIVNFYEESKEITILDYVFEDGYKGAVGSVFVPVSEDEIQDTISEYEDEPMELLKYMADNGFEITSGLIDSLDTSREGLLNLFFDRSYSDKWDYLREELKLSEDEAVIFNCIGGGRCFNKDFEGNVNPELSPVIREYES